MHDTDVRGQHDLRGPVGRGRPWHRWVARSRIGHGAGVGAVWVVPALLALVVVVDLVVVSVTGSPVAMAVTLSHLPLVVVAAALHGRRTSALSSTSGLLAEVGSRAEQVEAALSRDEETLHEVRATVVGLSLAVHLLRESHDELPEATRARLETMHASELERLERLLTDGPREDSGPVPLAEVVEPFVDSVRARGQRVVWSGTRYRAWGRRDEVAEIVHVLLENAARHAPGSDVAVEVARRGGQVELRVSDRGPGVPPDLAATLFERGVRAHASPGQGIGLQLARRLSREMGGDLRLEPGRPGVGAAFALTLPGDPSSVERVATSAGRRMNDDGEVA